MGVVSRKDKEGNISMEEKLKQRDREAAKGKKALINNKSL